IALIEEETKKALFKELNWQKKMTSTQLLKWLGYSSKEWKLNFKQIQGNRTNTKLLDVYKEILDSEGYDNINFKNISGDELTDAIKQCFDTIGIDVDILNFEPNLAGNAFAQQKSYQLWHLLYS